MAVVPKCLLAGSPADSRSTIRDAIRISNDQAAQALPFRGYKALLIRKPTSSETAAAFSNVNHFYIYCWSPLPLQLRYLQTLNSISAENNSTIIFPVRIIADTTSSTIMKVYMYWSSLSSGSDRHHIPADEQSYVTPSASPGKLFSFQFDLTLPILLIVKTLPTFLCCCFHFPCVHNHIFIKRLIMSNWNIFEYIIMGRVFQVLNKCC